MKFTFSWLKDHLDTSHSLTEICDALPMLGLEVESLSDPFSIWAIFWLLKLPMQNATPMPTDCRYAR